MSGKSFWQYITGLCRILHMAVLNHFFEQKATIYGVGHVEKQKNARLHYVMFLLWIFGSLGLYGCDYGPSSSTQATSVPLLSTANTITVTNLPAPSQIVTQNPSPGTSITSKPSSTSTPTLPPEPTPIIAAGPFQKSLLITVRSNTEIIGLAREEIWLLEPGDKIPKALIQSKEFSYQMPGWAHDGKWIAFEQRTTSLPITSQIGVLLKDDPTQQLILPEIYQSLGSLNWSFNDRWITFTAVEPGTGINPYSWEIGADILTNLHPHPDIPFSAIWLSPSPHDDRLALLGETHANDSPKIEMWLITPNEAKLVHIPIAMEMFQGCDRVVSIDWSPDGQSLLAQFGVAAPQKSCLSGLWLFHMESATWTKVADPPENDPNYLRINWAPDGRWVAWTTLEKSTIYNTATWEIVRELNLNSFQTLMVSAWLRDTADNAILSVNEVNIAKHPFFSFLIWGISPNGSPEDDTIIAEIANEMDWLPEEASSIPVGWQP